MPSNRKLTLKHIATTGDAGSSSNWTILARSVASNNLSSAKMSFGRYTAIAGVLNDPMNEVTDTKRLFWRQSVPKNRVSAIATLTRASPARDADTVSTLISIRSSGRPPVVPKNFAAVATALRHNACVDLGV